jgi:molybdate transport system ATP-binding protein
MIELSVHKALNFSEGVLPLNIHLNIQKGEFIALQGQSGAGKTSILRIIAGLMQPDSGCVVVDNKKWFSSRDKINLKPQIREVGFAFQDYALFPNMTVRENLTFALKKRQNPSIIENLIELIDLGNLQHIKPQKLSGGQQQRVALARALVQQPKLLLLDEPLSALDANMRTYLQDYLIKTHKEFGITTIMVSHDANEIMKLANRVIQIEQGKIIRIDTPKAIFQYSKYQLKGRIIKIEKLQNQSILTVQIGDNQIQISKNNHPPYSIDDIIEIDFSV